MIQPASSSNDPHEMIRTASVGTVIHGFSKEDEHVFIDFLVREKSARLSKIPTSPPVEVRAGALIEQNILVAVTLFRFIPEGPVYEVFWNFHASDPFATDGNIFEHMCAEPLLTFHFYGDDGEIENVIEVTNTLKNFFRDVTQQAVALLPWTIEEFQKAKTEISLNYSTPEKLWKALEKK